MARITFLIGALFVYSSLLAQDTFNGMISTYGDQDFEGMNGIMEMHHSDSSDSDASFNGVMTLFEPQPEGLSGEMNGVMDAFSITPEESVRVFKNQRNDLIPALKVQSFFSINSHQLTLESEDNLRKLLPTLRSDGVRTIYIYGYADATGPARFNQWLSEKRAESVQNWLIKNGVKADVIQIKGMGPQQNEPQEAASWRRSDLMVEIR